MSVLEAIKASLGLLSARDRRLLTLAIALQVLLSGLDLIGVLLLGLVGALAVTTVQSQPAPPIVTSIADVLGLQGLSSQALVGILAVAAATSLLIKSAASVVIIRRVLRFLANRQAILSGRMIRDLFSSPVTFLHRRSSQETAYALIQGATAATLAILGQLVIVVTELSVLVVLAVALLFIDPWITIGCIVYFSAVAYMLHRLMGNWAFQLGRRGKEADIASLKTIQEALAVYREISVFHRREFYVNRFQELRWKSASVAADRSFTNQVPKYVFEAALVVGGVCLAGALFLTQDSVAAVGSLTLFLAAASRVMPALLRLQGAFLGLRDNSGIASATFDLASELTSGHVVDVLQAGPSSPSCDTSSQRFPVDIVVDSASFKYPATPELVLRDVSIRVAAGTSLALIGRSGAGKSTLVDLMLGILTPESGLVRVAGEDPRDLVRDHPGLIAYVPQSVGIVNGTVKENVALGLPQESVPDDEVWRALEQVDLAGSPRLIEHGLDTSLGEHGIRLSGGQRQRLGIARALLLSPSLLVLDEATSSLDAETEHAIQEVIAELHGHVTIVAVAHRLSTVRNADLVAYMEGGRIECAGTFDEVRGKVPALERQASLLGIQ